LFTQCSKCETVFKLSADVLRAAGGQVRCGKCGEVFNALARLAEDPGAFAPTESEIDLEVRADSILESPAPPQVPRETVKEPENTTPSGVEVARLEILEWSDDELKNDGASGTAADTEEPSDDTSMEFTLPPGELDRIFVESKARQRRPPLNAPVVTSRSGAEKTPQPPRPPDAPVVTSRSGAERTPQPPRPPDAPVVTSRSSAERTPQPPRPSDAPVVTSRSSAEKTPQPATPPDAPVVASRSSAEKTPQPATPPVPPAATSRSGMETAPQPAVHLGVIERRSADRAAPPNGFEVPEEIRREMLLGLQPEELEAEEPLYFPPRPTTPRAFIGWLSAALASALLLIGQVVHQNREWLGNVAPLGAALRTVYSGLGAPVPQPANFSAYQLRQWGVTGDPAADGTLRVRVSILNAAPQLEPYPLLRVSLANRFGGTIGSRDFEPAEYLGKPIARLLVPGERVDAIMDILDPGKSAEGFEIDVCLRGADKKISCANDAVAQAKR
jgi:predicted Zn finger-like uncharacterized protein